MTNTLFTLLATIAQALALAGLAAYCVHMLQRGLPRRIARLEEALRVYNSANATLGRQVAELETALAALREAPSPAARPAAQSPETRAGAVSAAERYELRAAPVAEPEFSAAELRLAQQIKSRLAAMRLN